LAFVFPYFFNLFIMHPFYHKIVLGTKVGRAKHMRVMPGGALERDQQDTSTGGVAGGTSGTSSGTVSAVSSSGNAITSLSSSMYVGRKLDEHRGAFVVEYPMDKGIVTDNGWDAMECLWEVC
jgi:hypothetical protein